MAEVYKFFNSAPGDERWHYASDFADYFSSVLSAGLLLDQNQEYGLQVTYDSGLNVKVSTGKALIKGYSYENTTDLILTHSLPETTLDRIDRVVLRLDLKNASRFIKAFIKEGIASETPVAPELQRDQYIYELSLAQVRLRANTASIETSDITDERALEDLCGIVQSLITVPTSVFQQQFDTWLYSQKSVYETNITEWSDDQQEEFLAWKIDEKTSFDAWIATLQNTLDENMAGNLLNLINDNTQTINKHQMDEMPHQYTDYTNGKKYKWGMGSENGVPYFVREEIV